ncbi:hypothetical protein KY284_033065 [Solanum tuberosum]|nr:hypothetical protein KY284_033065 [Solanum tuberosum]
MNICTKLLVGVSSRLAGGEAALGFWRRRLGKEKRWRKREGEERCLVVRGGRLVALWRGV